MQHMYNVGMYFNQTNVTKIKQVLLIDQWYACWRAYDVNTQWWVVIEGKVGCQLVQKPHDNRNAGTICWNGWRVQKWFLKTIYFRVLKKNIRKTSEKHI